MSMILDALSRAEKERQSENAIDLDKTRYATSSTIKEDRFKKWVLAALVANFGLIIILALGYIWKTNLQKQSVPVSKIEILQSQKVTEVAQDRTRVLPASQEMDEQYGDVASGQITPQSISLTDASNKTLPATSLLDETKVRKTEAVKAPSKKPIKNIVRKTPPVQYSSKPLSAPRQTSKPTVASVTAAVERQQHITNVNSSDYNKLSDIPVSERQQLSQYEVNVHVYDDSGQASFVLINMVKYKQGDKLPGGGAFVSAIIPEGVVVDYGGGKALIERNQ